MYFKIHRGTKEIGGSCVEVWTSNTRIIVDMGMPLVNDKQERFDFTEYKDQDVDNLVKLKVLPDIKGIYKADANPIDGILISHAHMDHFGLINFVSDDIKLHLGKATHKIIEVFNIFTNSTYQIKKFNHFENEKAFQIGDIKITPYLNDHSAFDSYSFLIEADGKSIFYSGDFRAHGRKEKLFYWFLHNAPQNVDYLLLEGTTIGRNTIKTKTESDIENELFDLFTASDKPNLIFTAGQNVDRLVSIYKAALKANKILVIDVYIAKILTELAKFSKLPHPSASYKNIKVMFVRSSNNKLVDDGNEKVMYQFSKYKITKEEMSDQADKIVMLVRSSMIEHLKRINNLKDGNFIYSMWTGYLQNEKTAKFVDYFKSLNFEIHNIHTSGHADLETLQKIVQAMKPNNIIPIHTFDASSYQSIFKNNVIQCNDGDIINV